LPERKQKKAKTSQRSEEYDKKASDREEVWIEEVECVHTELFAMNQELSKKGLLSNNKMVEET
jgi:hypothetical protein